MRKFTLLLFWSLAVLGPTFTSAQGSGTEPYSGINATPKAGGEFGIHAGHFFFAGDIQWSPGYGVGLHYRKALDYIFSIRLDAMYANGFGDSESNGARYLGDLYLHNTTYASFTIQGVITLNNLKWDRPKRKANLYALVGGGPVYTKTGVESKLGNYMEDDIVVPGRASGNLTSGVEVGAGVAFRLGQKMNLGVEYKAMTVFGKRTDLLDGFDNRWRDIGNYAAVRFNFNLTSKGKKSEPLYWINPLDVVLNDISELRERPVLDLTDTDGDGVIDLIDQEKDTPPGAPVDTRGVTLDSDNDGIADYLDGEPYSPPGVAVDGNGISTVPQSTITEGDVESIVNRILEERFGQNTGNPGANGLVGSYGGSSAAIFLPMIHFSVDSYNIRYADYGNLASIADMLQRDPALKIVISGHTDKSGNNDYNKTLSYKRAQATVDHLVNVHQIDPSRLVLQYGGDEVNLVPAAGSSLMNRRVEFRVATSAEESMLPPDADP
ncbi:MAG: OmpA family protein, partial [Bacteroidota bacterium]